MNPTTIRDQHINILKDTLLLLFISLFCLSCEAPMVEEETTQEKDTPNHENANLIVSIFQLEQMPFAVANRSTPSEASTRLNYAVYDMEGTRVKQVNQIASEAEYGTAYFQLPVGDYQLVALAHSSNGNPTMTDLSKVKFTNAQGFSDTFLAYQTVTVTDQPQTLSLSLRRIVFLCRFIVTDDYQENVTRLQFQYKGGSGAFNAKTGFGSVNSIQTVSVDAAQGLKQFDLYTFLHDTEGTIHLTVSALDASGVELLKREFDVAMKQNCISCVSGPLFSGTNTTTHSITGTILIDTTWADTYYYTF